MNPDFDRAATLAAETLIKNNICSSPVSPLPILKRMKGVIVVSFAEISDSIDMDRSELITMFNVNQDAVTSVHVDDGKLRYVVAYNQRLPFYMLQRGLSRELGHIVLGHDGSRPAHVRYAEAVCFAYHLLCPRALIHAMQEAGAKMTIETLGNLTGCYERCLSGMRKTPATHVPAELNRKIREQFSEYIDNFLDYHAVIAKDDDSVLADFGTYMDGYEG